MKTWKDLLPWDAIGPIVFLIAAGGLCFMLEPDARAKVLPMVIGAALTRVRTVVNQDLKK